MRAILINPTEQAITEVDYDGSLESIKGHIDAPLFDVVRLNEAGDAMFVDDEGLYNAKEFFRVEGLEHPIAGKALALGTDYEGNSVEPMLESVETLEDKVFFIDVEEAITMADALDVKAEEMKKKYGEGFIYISVADILKNREYTPSSE